MAGAVSVGSRPLPVVVEHDAQIVHEGRVWGLKKVATSEARSAEASVKLALPFMAVVSVIRNFACRSVRVPKSTPRLCSDCTRPPARTVRRWEFRGITARRGEVDGATPFGHLLAAADSGGQVRRLFRADKSAP